MLLRASRLTRNHVLCHSSRYQGWLWLADGWRHRLQRRRLCWPSFYFRPISWRSSIAICIRSIPLRVSSPRAGWRRLLPGFAMMPRSIGEPHGPDSRSLPIRALSACWKMCPTPSKTVWPTRTACVMPLLAAPGDSRARACQARTDRLVALGRCSRRNYFTVSGVLWMHVQPVTILTVAWLHKQPVIDIAGQRASNPMR